MFKAFTDSTNEPVHSGQEMKFFMKSVVDGPRFMESNRVD
jgi:hypothetical protein